MTANLTHRHGQLLLLTAALIPLIARPAHAQQVNYRSFEELFGEPVTVSASGKPQRVSEAPAAMTVVTADMIEHSGASTIPQVLRLVAGVDIRDYGMQDTTVSIRGAAMPNNSRLLVLVDGRSVYQDDYGFTFWSSIPVALTDIRQIEVIKGPASALYGFNAVAGVINIVTRNPTDDPHVSARVSGGTQGQTNGEIVASRRLNNTFSGKISLTGSRSQEFPSSVSFNHVPTPQTGTAAFELDAKITRHITTSLSGSASWNRSAYFLDIGIYTPEKARTINIRSHTLADTKAGLFDLDIYHTWFSPYVSWSSLPTRLTLEGQPLYFPGQLPTSLAYTESQTNLQLSDLIRISPQHTLRGSFEFRQSSLTADWPSPKTLSSNVLSGDLMWDWQITPALTMTNAVRIDAFHLGPGTNGNVPGTGMVPFRGRSIRAVSFNSALVYKFHDGDSVRLSAARGAQLPGLLSFSHRLIGGPLMLSGNSALVPAITQNFGLDYAHKISPLNAQLNLNLFAQYTTDVLSSAIAGKVSLTNSGIIVAPANYPTSKAAGGELTLSGKTGFGLRWNAAWALTLVHDNATQAEQINPSITWQKSKPVHIILAGLGYSWNKFSVDLNMRWQSHFTDAFTTMTQGAATTPVSSFVTLDGQAAWAFTRHTKLFISARQMNRSVMQQTAGFPIERQVYGGVRADF
ncbi:TonB-dependent receptor plug domain-containing protein [Acetobacter sp. AN02]|uniref:TonB-dependent receptor plug domain-containing protein n=1 Tax=Acetobacter sp. AN02 TaxID=2894186 RepID=UPI0024346171|nr:TonB-dependent receptor [Acetobacter sp. AN02]MDG6094995.1 TonB-dependent receptor plug domain-containing protein [Acetobacter sp. AN02]